MNAAEPLALLFRDLPTCPSGLNEREAARRLAAWGPNRLIRRHCSQGPREIAAQLLRPLAILLAAAAAPAWFSGNRNLGIAIVAVIVVSGAFAFC